MHLSRAPPRFASRVSHSSDAVVASLFVQRTINPAERGLTAGSDARVFHGDESQPQQQRGPLGPVCGTRSAAFVLERLHLSRAPRSRASLRDAAARTRSHRYAMLGMPTIDRDDDRFDLFEIIRSRSDRRKARDSFRRSPSLQTSAGLGSQSESLISDST